MHQNVEAFAVEHQPWHDALELFCLKDDVELRDWVRSARLIAERAGFYGETADDGIAQPFGDRPGGGIEIDMGVITSGLGHCKSSCCFVRFMRRFRPALPIF